MLKNRFFVDSFLTQVWFPEEAGVVTTHLENSMFLGDWVTNVAYAAVVAVLAPVWEELIFRGFLVSSLLRFLPPWGLY